MIGGNGDDSLTGAAQSETLRGGPGADTITGLAGVDSVFGEAGDDTLSMRDGRPRRSSAARAPTLVPPTPPTR